MRDLGDRLDTSFSKIEALWALANYFKHRDEWDRSTWDTPTGLAKHTVPVIKAAGLVPASNGNLRTGAQTLGNPDYRNLAVFEDIIRRWASDVRRSIHQAFGR